MTAPGRVIGLAAQEEGYHEQGENVTKYAADIDKTGILNGPKNGFAWCAVFVIWLFFKLFGEQLTLDMLYLMRGSCAAACEYFAQYFTNAGAFHHNIPEPGDIIFFYASGGINHMGIVEKVLGGYVYTYEGNSGDAVRHNSYRVDNATIAGYGRPDWSLVEDLPEDDESDSAGFIGSRRYMTLMFGDGMDGRGLRRVEAWQCFLNLWGYDVEPDGQFGPLTKAATMKFQARVGLDVNGIVDEDDWDEIIKIEVV